MTETEKLLEYRWISEPSLGIVTKKDDLIVSFFCLTPLILPLDLLM